MNLLDSLSVETREQAIELQRELKPCYSRLKHGMIPVHETPIMFCRMFFRDSKRNGATRGTVTWVLAIQSEDRDSAIWFVSNQAAEHRRCYHKALDTLGASPAGDATMTIVPLVRQNN
jgi:hypothetical protein